MAHFKNQIMLAVMNKRGTSRTETLVKLVLIFVISLLSFSVGTFVGKQFSDSQHKMASLEKEFHGDRATASAKEDSEHGSAKKEGALTDQDIASLTEEFIEAAQPGAEHGKEQVAHQANAHAPIAELVEHATDEKKHAPTPAEPAHQETASKDQPAHLPAKQHGEVMEAAKRIAKDMTPSPATVAKERVPSSLPSMVSASTVGKYTVQISSYQTEDEAKTHAKKLMDKGFNAFYLEADISGKKWYRVSVGLFSTKASADQYKKSLVEQTKVGSAIVQKIIK